MKRHLPGISPFLPVPLHERQRLATLAHLSLAELRTARPTAMPDLQALVAVCKCLVVTDRYTDEAHAAVQRADEALQGMVAGTASQPAAVAACTHLVSVFEALIASVTWRRLQAAQEAARRQATTPPPRC